ncbi:6-phosphofructokinase [Desulforegula conservatrix]|uniref:6-phosphofructokinase n=1 Tax=Desulforegula conservatrix TaxID=153026 RepID=UPI00040100C5|nr:6-phosphofructokinase [Desulforegula conservatrix]
MLEKSGLSPEYLINHAEVTKVVEEDGDWVRERLSYKPPVCDAFKSGFNVLEPAPEYTFDKHPEALRKLPHIISKPVYRIKGINSSDGSKIDIPENWKKKRNIGIVFSGGPSPGGHNVIAGLFDSAKKANPENRIYGFLAGPDGIIDGQVVEITKEIVAPYRNIGGFSMIKTGRTKVDTPEKTAFCRETCRDYDLDAIVIVGGDDSNTNAAFLAESLYADGVQVIGVPKTIDGDIQVKTIDGEILCAMSFGFHTAARGFAKSISDLCTDCSSDVKYWHICKVMGRVASHLALEVAFQTHANMTFIGEELADYVDYSRLEKAGKRNEIDYTAYGMTLRNVSRVICDAIVKRAAVGKNYGLIVIPEGLLEFINEIQIFIIKLNTIIADYNRAHDDDFHTTFAALEDKLDYLRRLARHSREDNIFSIWNTRDDDLFNDIPPFFQEGLLMERDSHGNFQFSQVETDKVLMGLVKDYLNILKEKGEYRIGIHVDYFKKMLKRDGFDPDYYGHLIFRNYPEEFLLVKKEIISVKTLKHALKTEKNKDDDILPDVITKIYKMSVPKFSTQSHFYGYDGRGGDPTLFDCNYTYNLGLSVFSLIAGGVTGQMAAIKNLEHDFESWEPIGIPIAPLMHLEERTGKLALVIEKSLVDVNSNAFKVFKATREKWLAAHPDNDCFRRPGPVTFAKGEEDRPIILKINSIR